MKKSLKVLILSSFLVLGVGCAIPNNSSATGGSSGGGNSNTGGNTSVNSTEVIGDFEETANATFTHIKGALQTSDMLSAKADISMYEYVHQDYVIPSAPDQSMKISTEVEMDIVFAGNFDVADIKSYVATGAISDNERTEYYVKQATKSKYNDEEEVRTSYESYYKDFVGYTRNVNSSVPEDNVEYKSVFDETAKNAMYTAFSQVAEAMEQVAALNTLEDVVELVSTMVPSESVAMVEMIAANLIPLMKYLAGDESVTYADISEFVESMFTEIVVSSSGVQEISPQMQEDIDKMLAFVRAMMEEIHAMKTAEFLQISKSDTGYTFSSDYAKLETTLKAFAEVFKARLEKVLSPTEYADFIAIYNTSILPALDTIGDADYSLVVETSDNKISGLLYETSMETSMTDLTGSGVNIDYGAIMRYAVNFVIGTTPVVVPTIDGCENFPEF